MNYIELAKTSMRSCVIKGIHYPDVRKFELPMSDQLKIEYIELGSCGNGISFDLGSIFNTTQTSLNKIVVYLDMSVDQSKNIEWLMNNANKGISVFAFDSTGNIISIKD